MITDILSQIKICISRGKVDQKSTYPSDLKGQKGAYELTDEALNSGIHAKIILDEALIPGMEIVGNKFRAGQIYVPDVLIAAKAMKSAMELIKPYFISGDVKYRGKVILGTVAGDLHDIGKNLLKMTLEGGGWEIIDLGVNAGAEKFLTALGSGDVKAVGLSALLTTTMLNMGPIAESIRKFYPDALIMVGGAPLSDSFAQEIGADFYGESPQEALEFLNEKIEFGKF